MEAQPRLLPPHSRATHDVASASLDCFYSGDVLKLRDEELNT
jgi:hypothetical protein